MLSAACDQFLLQLKCATPRLPDRQAAWLNFIRLMPSYMFAYLLMLP